MTTPDQRESNRRRRMALQQAEAKWMRDVYPAVIAYARLQGVDKQVPFERFERLPWRERWNKRRNLQIAVQYAVLMAGDPLHYQQADDKHQLYLGHRFTAGRIWALRAFGEEPTWIP